MLGSEVSGDLQGRANVFKLMESQILHQLSGSVSGRFKKGTMVSVASARLYARHFSLPLNATGAFQVATPVLEFRGSESD